MGLARAIHSSRQRSTCAIFSMVIATARLSQLSKVFASSHPADLIALTNANHAGHRAGLLAYVAEGSRLWSGAPF